MRSSLIAVVISATLLVSACSALNPEPRGHSSSLASTGDEESQSLKQLTGTLNYRERIRMAPDSKVEVSLLDVTRADAKSIVMATTVISEPGNPPVPFILEYDPQAIDTSRSYHVRAKLKRGERLQMTTDQAYPVLTRGGGSEVELMLVSVSPQAPVPNAELTNTYWKLVELNGSAYQHTGKGREPHIKFDAGVGLASGHAGCNTFSGGFESEGNQLRLKTIASTRKACIDGMDTEAVFLKLLQSVERFEIEGDTLTFSSEGVPVLRFTAIYF